MYNQGIGTTADSEHTIASSMYPLENGRVFQKYFSNKWNDIYSELKENGYYTSFMHPNVNTFWNRYLVYNTGYKIDEYNDISMFNSNDEMAGEFFSDEQFLTQAVYKMTDYKEPFICMMSAISTHIPYSLEGISNLDGKLSIDVSGIESDEISRYLLACNFVDYSFGKFMEEIENTDLLENSILIVYGDHGAGLQDLEAIELICKQNGKDYNENIESLLNVHIPFGMKIPNLDGRVIENSVSKIDIKPTIMNLLNIEDKFSIGTDVFSGKDYSFIKGIGYVTKENYYINGEYKGEKTNSTDTFEYTGLSPKTKYTIQVEIRNSTTDEYIGSIVKQISTIDANKPELTGFNADCTYYVLYDDEGNETIGEKIKNDGSNMPSNWYDYSQSKWANIVVQANGKTTYFTWIPRYEFMITASQSAQISIGRTETRFIEGISTETDTGYQIPEAFTFDGKQLTGYWAMKYTAGD